MQTKENELPRWVCLIVFWPLAIYFIVIYHLARPWPPSAPTSMLEGAFLWIALLCFLIPFAKVLRIGTLIELQRELRGDLQSFKSEVRQQMMVINSNLSAQANVTVNLQEAQGDKPKEEPVPADGARTATEYKILNTLWNKQVNKFPTLSTWFGFKASFPQADRLLEYTDAWARLLRDGLITRPETDFLYLTEKGLKYCSKHYKEFPTDMWFDKQELNEANLQEALRAVEALSA